MWQLRAYFVKWIALAVCILGLAGVSTAQPTGGTCPVGGYAIPACPVDSDGVIQDQAISRLSGSVASARYPITVGVCNGVVTLRGMVQTSGKRDLANLFAWSVRGVIDVQNELTVDPKTADDIILVGEVRKAFNKSAIDSKQIQVETSDGVVQIAGIVTTEVDREMASLVAASVPGVTAVYNNITVRGPSGSPF